MQRRLIAAAVACSLAGGIARSDEPPPDDGWTRGKIISLSALGGLYTTLSVWAYFAWYRDTPEKPFLWGGDGLFGVNTYAGGADKLGHFWSNHTITRATSEMLMSGGWRPLPASLIAGGLSAFAFTMVEVKDGYYYEFSFGDLTFDYLGVALGATMVNFPALDRLFDFRLDYWPTKEYLEILRGDKSGGSGGAGEGGKVTGANFAEDYSGQTYFLATHLSAIPPLRRSAWTRWTRYVDLGLGFYTRNYKPPPDDTTAIPRQHLFLGAAIDFQAILEDLYREPGERGPASPGHRALHEVFEFWSPPYTTLPVIEGTRSRSAM